MKLNRKQKDFVSKLIDWWEDQELLSEGQSPTLRDSIDIKIITWKKIAKYLIGFPFSYRADGQK
jgi:hypothetical protein